MRCISSGKCECDRSTIVAGVPNKVDGDCERTGVPIVILISFGKCKKNKDIKMEM